MSYTGYTIHKGSQHDGYSVQNPTQLATVLEAMDTALQAAGDVANAAAATATALTDSTTGTASQTLAAGTGVYYLTLPIAPLVNIANGDVVTNFTPGHKFKLLGINFVTQLPVTTGSKNADIYMEIGTTNVTGGVVALTSASCTPMGQVIAGTAITAANTGAANATVSVIAGAVTAFSEGTGHLQIKIQNMDTADAAASITDEVNKLITDVANVRTQLNTLKTTLA